LLPTTAPALAARIWESLKRRTGPAGRGVGVQVGDGVGVAVGNGVGVGVGVGVSVGVEVGVGVGVGVGKKAPRGLGTAPKRRGEPPEERPSPALTSHRRPITIAAAGSAQRCPGQCRDGSTGRGSVGARASETSR
jgi:hypothetical protein